MLGIILIYYVGKQFYELAGRFNKHQWGYAILGVLSYYIGTFVFGIILFIVLELGDYIDVDSVNDFEANLMALPFGVLTCWGFYHILKRNWSRRGPSLSDDILDAGAVENF